MKSITADFSMLLTGIIWGLGFVACQYSINSGMPAPLILFLRFGISAIVMIIIFYKKIITITKEEFKLGMLAGIFLFCAFFCQTVGLQNTVLSNNAFITSTDVILVPFITWVIFKRRPSNKLLILPFFTFLGIAILSYSPGMGNGLIKGDAITLLGSFFYALHISYLDVVAKKVDAIKLTFLQMSIAGVMGFLLFGGVNKFSFSGVDRIAGLWPILFLSLFSTLLGFFIQTAAQKYTTSTKAAIFLSTESLFGALFSVLLKLEPFTVNLLIGGSMIMFTIFASEIKITGYKKEIRALKL